MSSGVAGFNEETSVSFFLPVVGAGALAGRLAPRSRWLRMTRNPDQRMPKSFRMLRHVLLSLLVVAGLPGCGDPGTASGAASWKR